MTFRRHGKNDDYWDQLEIEWRKYDCGLWVIFEMLARKDFFSADPDENK